MTDSASARIMAGLVLRFCREATRFEESQGIPVHTRNPWGPQTKPDETFRDSTAVQVLLFVGPLYQVGLSTAQLDGFGLIPRPKMEPARLHLYSKGYLKGWIAVVLVFGFYKHDAAFKSFCSRYSCQRRCQAQCLGCNWWFTGLRGEEAQSSSP